MSSTKFLFRNASTPFSFIFLFPVFFLILISTSSSYAQELMHEGISLRVANFDYEEVTVFDPESFNEVLIVMLKDKMGKDVGTISLSRINYEEKASIPTQQKERTKVMRNRKTEVTTLDKGMGQWIFENNVKIDQYKAQYYKLDSKIAREGQLFLIETIKEQIIIKFVYKKGVDENLVRNFKDWITEVKTLINQSPRNN